MVSGSVRCQEAFPQTNTNVSFPGTIPTPLERGLASNLDEAADLTSVKSLLLVVNYARKFATQQEINRDANADMRHGSRRVRRY